MPEGRQGSSVPGLVGLQFCHPRGVGVGKDCLFLSGSSSSSLVSCIQISGRVVLKFLPLIWTWCRLHHIPHPTTWDKSHASTSPATLPCSDGLLEQLLTYIDVPKSLPRFPSLWSLIGASTTTFACSIPIISPSKRFTLLCLKGYWATMVQ